jgi:holo-[acyl-carrier protein] synthase
VIGIGVDLVEVDRMRDVLARTPTMVEKLFTPGEREYAQRAKDPTERYAARFAAKEAVLKALGLGLGAADWHDIEVVKDDAGAPSVVLTGRARAASDAAGVSRWLLTLTHTDSMAEAIAVAL